MIIRNALVYTIQHRFEKKDILIREGRIEEVSVCGKQFSDAGEMVDAEGLYAIPGLVDIHLHGALGYDFCQAAEEEVSRIADYEAQNGILAICPTTMSYNEEILGKILDKLGNCRTESGADLIGINMEGPFINPEKAGAQNPKYITKADSGMYERLQRRCNGKIKMIDIAPEGAGAMEFIERYHEQVKISLAHTCCDYDMAKTAFARGACHVTHLFNAMSEINHRAPGPVIAALEAGAEVELIADGIHIHPAIIRTVFRMFGAEKVILISDSMEAAGLQDGEYQLGGQQVTVKGRRAVLTKDLKTIAGSVTNLFDCMRNCVQIMQIPLEDAVRAATENPARSLGVERDYGKIDRENYGNILLLNQNLTIQKIIVRGKIQKRNLS